jgi:hypothetical protein
VAKRFLTGGYSVAFRAKPGTGRNYTIKNAPAGLWTALQHRCRQEQVSVRAKLLQLVTAYVNSPRPEAPEPQ